MWVRFRVRSVVVLSVCCTLFGCISFTPALCAQDKAQAPDKTDRSNDELLQFSGNVVDPEGKPVAGAKIFAVTVQRDMQPDPNVKSLATTDQDGRFQITLSTKEFRDQLVNYQYSPAEGYFAATAEGYGFGQMKAILLETTGQLSSRLKPDERSNIELLRSQGTTIRLVPDDVPMTGRIINTEGLPVPGLRVRVLEVKHNDANSLDDWEKSTTAEKADYYSVIKEVPKTLRGWQVPSVISDAQTNDDGQFTIRGIGRERVAQLEVSGPGIEWTQTYARTRNEKPVVLRFAWNRPLSPNNTVRIHGSEMNYVVTPSVPIVGRVTDVETGQPIPGVKIDPGYASTVGSGARYLTALTDADGRYRLDGTQLLPKHPLIASPPEDSAYLPSGAQVELRIDQKEAVQDFQLRTGIQVRGRVVDSRTGEAISGTVRYSALRLNKHVSKYPGFVESRREYMRYTDDGGRFAISVAPGAGIITFRAVDFQKFARAQGADSIPESKDKSLPNRLYPTAPTAVHALDSHSLLRIEFEPGTETAEVTFDIRSGTNVSGKIIDTEGNPVEGALASLRIDGTSWVPLKDANFRVDGVYPDKQRIIAFYHPKRNLAACYRFDHFPAEPLTITLQPAATIRGRLVDKNGVPLRGVFLFGDDFPNARDSTSELKLLTDEEGRFEIHGLVPGHKYSAKATLNNRFLGVALNEVSVESNEVKDIGDVTPEYIMTK